MKTEFQKKRFSFYPPIVDPCDALGGLILLPAVA
jgi:hypothetical protein